MWGGPLTAKDEAERERDGALPWSDGGCVRISLLSLGLKRGVEISVSFLSPALLLGNGIIYRLMNTVCIQVGQDTGGPV